MLTFSCYAMLHAMLCYAMLCYVCHAVLTWGQQSPGKVLPLLD